MWIQNKVKNIKMAILREKLNFMNNFSLFLFTWIFEYFINVRLHLRVIYKKNQFETLMPNLFNNNNLSNNFIK